MFHPLSTGFLMVATDGAAAAARTACCCRLPHQLEQSLAIAAAPLVNTQSMTPYSPWRTFLLLLLLPLLLCLGELMSATLDN
jgi:hypothetical protein